ncbi:FtsX-like permease family protein [Catenulispora sp. NL8]|uniref:FtsX-like permease family protein n=1 Tax=Catenulispora pinistramenti TaxID=2705254 RepID=A0ABS5KIA0_9ACTN|nr:FtsX-like permease family protein [Catenulispora pinistramenti]MBS2545833.1 FtsX-like permease family protein [Catenulispora pinistramenti]
MWKASRRNFFAHKGRLSLSLIAVVLSVAFVTGTLMFTSTITTTFNRLFATTASDVAVSAKADKDAPPGAPEQTVPASLLGTIKAMPGVQAVYGDISTDRLAVVGPDNKSISNSAGGPTIGANWYPTPHPAVDLTSGRAPSGPGDVVVDADTAAKKHLTLGSPLRIVTGSDAGSFQATVSGIATFRTTNPGESLFYFDTNTAQTKLLGQAGVYTGVNLDAKPGTSDDTLKAEVTGKLGPGYDVKTRAEQEADGRNSVGFIGFMKYVMLGFAGISLMVGAFLIVNTFQMLVAQRTRELGLLRALGASRRQVNRSVRFEALMLGVIGATLGIAAGAGMAYGLIAVMNGVGMNLQTSDMSVTVSSVIAGYAVGVLVTLLAAWVPARRAARITPMAALRDAGTPGDRRSSRIRNGIGLVIGGGGAAALIGGAASGATATGGLLLGLGVLVTLVGAILLGPLLAGVVIRVLGVWMPAAFGSVGTMAQRNALRNPRRTGATAAALMIGLSLVSGMAVVGSSLVTSASAEMDRSVGADYIITTNGGLVITPEALAQAQATPGLAHVTENKFLNANVSGTSGDGKIEFAAASPTMTQDFDAGTTAGSMADVFSKEGIAIPQTEAKSRNAAIGSVLTVAFHGGTPVKLPVLAIISDKTVFNHGDGYVSLATLGKSVPAAAQPQDTMLFAKADKGQQNQAYAALKDRLAPFPQVTVKSQTDYKKLIQDQVGGVLNMVYGLLGLAIVVAILGVVNTLALSVVERTREIGLIRAIGMGRRKTRRMIRLESVVIALFGAALGVGLGLAWGVAAQRVLSGIGISTLAIPVTTIVAVFIGAAVVGLLAALAPSFRASRMNVLRAIAADG